MNSSLLILSTLEPPWSVTAVKTGCVEDIVVNTSQVQRAPLSTMSPLHTLS